MELPEVQRNETLDRFRGAWMFHREPYQDTAPSREEAAPPRRPGQDAPVHVTHQRQPFAYARAPPHLLRDGPGDVRHALPGGVRVEGSYDPDGMGGWPVSVSFRYGDSADDGDTFFILSQHGIYTQDGESLRLNRLAGADGGDCPTLIHGRHAGIGGGIRNVINAVSVYRLEIKDLPRAAQRTPPCRTGSWCMTGWRTAD